MWAQAQVIDARALSKRGQSSARPTVVLRMLTAAWHAHEEAT
jgi:hypothetical protein